jgi:hypothetical protein
MLLTEVKMLGASEDDSSVDDVKSCGIQSAVLTLLFAMRRYPFGGTLIYTDLMHAASMLTVCTWRITCAPQNFAWDYLSLPIIL